MEKTTDARGISRRGFIASAPVVVASLSSNALAQGNGPIVKTALGQVRGDTDGGVLRFRGMRYGADTGGANRFLPPQTVASWTGIYDATAYGPTAPQSNPATGRHMVPADPPGVDESEDCLRLNVWTPATDRKKRPVMVWLHGGGFSTGSASAANYDGSNLARTYDLVFVGVNHRLNIFGYSNLARSLGPKYESSANAGMLDIVAALQWVHDNIAAFGGDPDNVTIFGESGGGAKVSCLLAMPTAHGLFHKAAIESGPGLSVGDAQHAADVNDMVLQELKIPPAEAKRILEVPARDILTAYFAVQEKLPHTLLGGGAGFSPVLEPHSIPRHPFDPGAAPISSNVPLLIGSNRHEATSFLRGAKKNYQLDADGLSKAVASTLPKGGADEVIAAYAKAHPHATPWELDVLITTDALMGARTRRLADLKSAQPAPVFVYRFDWETKVWGDGKMGAPHAIEIPFVFRNVEKTIYMVGSEPSTYALADRVSAAWATFARTGNPTTPALPTWKPYSVARRDVMVINSQSRMERDPEGDLRSLVMSRL